MPNCTWMFDRCQSLSRSEVSFEEVTCQKEDATAVSSQQFQWESRMVHNEEQGSLRDTEQPFMSMPLDYFDCCVWTNKRTYHRPKPQASVELAQTWVHLAPSQTHFQVPTRRLGVRNLLVLLLIPRLRQIYEIRSTLSNSHQSLN